MTNQTNRDAEVEVSRVGRIGKQAFKYVAVAALSVVTILALVGGYVLTDADLRNATIDHAQGQELPKE